MNDGRGRYKPWKPKPPPPAEKYAAPPDIEVIHTLADAYGWTYHEIRSTPLLIIKWLMELQIERRAKGWLGGLEVMFYKAYYRTKGAKFD